MFVEAAADIIEAIAHVVIAICNTEEPFWIKKWMTEKLREENTRVMVIGTVLAWPRGEALCTNGRFVLFMNVVHLI